MVLECTIQQLARINFVDSEECECSYLLQTFSNLLWDCPLLYETRSPFLRTSARKFIRLEEKHSR